MTTGSGHLAQDKEGLCAFEYSAEWLNSGFSISPFELPLRSGSSPNLIRLKADSAFLMIVCPMAGDC